jgi:uncharacterized membrane protein YdbT with pleckstrin-like domain
VTGATDQSPSIRSDGASGSDGQLPWLALESGEEIRWRGGPRVQTLYPWLGLMLLGMTAISVAVVSELVSVRGLAWLPIVALVPLWQYVRLSRTAFVITDRHIVTKRGVFGRAVETVALERVQNTTVSQGALGRAVGYGTVAAESASGSVLRFWNVDEPIAVRAELEDTADRRQAAVPGTRTQWTAVLEEVRGWRRGLEAKKAESDD